MRRPGAVACPAMRNETGAGGGEQVLLQPGDREPGAIDGGGDVAAEVTAAEQVRPYCAFQHSLRAGEAGGAGADVLQEAQPAAGPQYPADLGERGVLVRDRAQHKGDDLAAAD